MYIPDHFAVTDNEEIAAFIRANAFGQLVSKVQGRLFSSHLPFMLSENRKYLYAHLARANPQWRNLQDQEVMITFLGPHDYVSPSWYQTAGLPPTWNYQAVHIYGHCAVIDDQDKLKTLVDKLTAKYEQSMDEPWVPDYQPSMLRGIIGLEITITEIQAKFKLSQNRSATDQLQVIEQLKLNGADELAEAMQQL